MSFYSTYKNGDLSEWYTTTEADEIIYFTKTGVGGERDVVLNSMVIHANVSDLNLIIISKTSGEEDSVLRILSGSKVSFSEQNIKGVKVLGALGQELRIDGTFGK